MKQIIIRFLSFIFIGCFISVGCKKDEKETINYFKYDQEKIEIGSALGLNLGESQVTGVYEIEIEFFEKSLNLVYTNGLADSLTGNGDVFVLTFLTNNEQEIPAGVYNYLNSGTSYKPNFISSRSYLVFNYDPVYNAGPEQANINGGNVTVSKFGNEYEFTFNLTTSLNTTITGYYKGVLLPYSNK